MTPLPDPATVLRSRAADVLNLVLCVFFIVGYVAVAWTLAFGPAKLHQSNSMQLVEGIGLPWPAWGAVYLGVAVLLTNRYSRFIGYFFGTGLCGFYLVSYLVSIHEGNPGSAPGVFAGYVAVLSQASGLVRSLIADEWRRPWTVGGDRE